MSKHIHFLTAKKSGICVRSVSRCAWRELSFLRLLRLQLTARIISDSTRRCISASLLRCWLLGSRFTYCLLQRQHSGELPRLRGTRARATSAYVNDKLERQRKSQGVVFSTQGRASEQSGSPCVLLTLRVYYCYAPPIGKGALSVSFVRPSVCPSRT